MKKGMITVVVLVAMVSTTLQSQAQTTSSEGNAANPAMSKNGNMHEKATDPGKNHAKVSRDVSGARPDSNALSNKFGRTTGQESREAREPSKSDGKVSVKDRSRSYSKPKKDNSSGKTFGNTGNN